jgi:hypothetical protein
MIFENPEFLKKRIESLSGRRCPSTPSVIENTSNVFAISSGDVLRLDGNDYYVKGEAREGRFGLDDEPKHWVKYAVDLTDGKNKIIKLEIEESFSTRIGLLLIKARRSAEKESDVLDVVRRHPHFMQGFSVADSVGNNVRIIDEIKGKSLFNSILDMHLEHEIYYEETYPDVLTRLIDCIEALDVIYENGLHHGDIRNDHVFIDKASGAYRWIDFDYTVTHADYDLWSLGNLIVFTAAGGLLLYKDLRQHPGKYPRCRGEVLSDDCSMYHKYRVANVKKVYPYVCKDINDICMRFAAGSFDLYDNLNALVEDLKRARDRL